MQVLHFLCVLITFILLTAYVQCHFMVIKCCNYGEELNANLTVCQPTNIASRSYSLSRQNISSSYVVMNVDSDSENNTWETEGNNTDLFWVPINLRNIIELDLSVDIGHPDKCSNAKTLRLEFPRDNNRVSWLVNGSLILYSKTVHKNNESHLFTPQDFCADSYTDNYGTRRSAILICGACNHVRCVKKCCPVGQAIVCRKGRCRCRPFDYPWSPFHPDLPLPEEDFPYEVVIDQNVTCKEDYEPNYNMFVGRPPYMIQRFWEKYLYEGEMCTETTVGVLASPGIGMRRCMRKPPFLKLLDNWLHVPEAVILGVAVLTLIVVPREKISAYSHVHDLSLFWHAACLLVRSLLWTIYLKAWYSCYVTPIFVYFFSVGATLWLNVLCINMVCGFWKPPGRPAARKGAPQRMFLWYALYAWGVTAAMTGFSAFMWYSLRAPSALLRPTLFETRTCFIEEEGDGKMATFAYFYGPVAWLLLVNAVLFAATAARVRYLRSSQGMLKGKESSSSSFRNGWSVFIYIKLLWLMGVVEMALEMVTWISNNHIYYNAVIVSCLDVLRAIAIFVFCCCNRRTLLALRDRFCACAPARLRKRCQQEPLCACAPVFMQWVLRSQERVRRMREWVDRSRQYCCERPQLEIDPSAVNGRYTRTVPDVISHM